MIYLQTKFHPKREIILDALRDLVPFVQFKKLEKHPCKSATLLILLHRCFVRFLNCTNVTKLRKASHMKIIWK